MNARSIAQLCNNHGANHYYTDRGGYVGIPAGATIQWYKVAAHGFDKAHRTQTAEGATRRRLYPQFLQFINQLRKRQMENLEQFMAKQAAALEKKKAELKEFAQLGDVPGLAPNFIGGKLHGRRWVNFKLKHLPTFTEWAREHCRPIHAFEGRYKGFYPERPETRDYADAAVTAIGDIVVSYSSIMRQLEAHVFYSGFRLAFGITGAYVPDLTPRAHYLAYSQDYHGPQKIKIDSWSKTNAGVRQYLRLGVDGQSADLETLLTWEQFEAYFLGKEE